MPRTLRSLTGYALGVLVGSLFFGSLSLASSGVTSVAAHYANIAIHIDGKTIATSAEPFIYNANVYVPISTIGHGLGAKVQWDSAKRDVVITDSHLAKVQQGELSYYHLPVYAGTHTVSYGGQTYVSGFALATIANLPYYLDQTAQTLYIGKGPSAGMPLSAFYDTRDYGDYAHLNKGVLGPDYGWSDGAPKIDGVTYPNDNSLVWAPQATNPVVPGVEYSLSGNYTSLTGAFGLDDGADGKEQVQLTLTGDGKQLYQSPWMGKAQPATPVSVNVTGVKLLTVSFAVQSTSGTVYSMGQALPQGMAVDIDFADVFVH